MSNIHEIPEEEIDHRAKEVFSAMEPRTTIDEMHMIIKAYEFAREAHRGQRRKTGEPYIIHPIAVAKIIASEMQLGAAPVCAAFLHDVVEDTPCTNEKIQELFGNDVAFLVRVVTKQDKQTYSMSKQLDNFKQMLDSMHYDVRAILIKLADRLHNMRTLDSMRPDKQMKIAGETDYFYAPLANRLGYYTIKIELENLSFRFRCPQEYKRIMQLIEKDKYNDRHKSATFGKQVDEILQKNGIRYRREVAYKQPYSIWRKMIAQHVDFEHLECRHFTRIIFPTDMYVTEKNMCLNIYSLLTDKFKERPGSLINYIDQPKQNGYQSFHTQLLSESGVWEEIHIQSERMRRKSYFGCMAETNRRDEDINQWLENFRNILREIANNPRSEHDGNFFIKSVRASFYNDDIQVYTPEGKSIKLPKGSTALDFAFEVHTEVGLHAKYAKINGHLASVKTVLKRGDYIEIGTDTNTCPKQDWCDNARTYKALRNINIFLDKQPKPKYKRCPVCNPIPGEEVVGFMNNKNREVSVHRRDCPEAISVASQYGDSIVAVDYKEDPDVVYPATLTAKAVDRQHLLSDIIDSISNRFQLSISELHTETKDEIVTCTINFFVHSYAEMETIVHTIQDIPDVDEVSYLNG
jgi:GTP pyrophosphokinase